jgi:hypothetical protein
VTEVGLSVGQSSTLVDRFVENLVKKVPNVERDESMSVDVFSRDWPGRNEIH